MNRLVNRIGRFPLAPAFALGALAALAAVAITSTREARSPAPLAFDPHAQTSGIDSTVAFVSRPIGVHAGASVHHVEALHGVRAHIHRTHDEIVVILEGDGTAHLADSSIALTPGLTLVIPRGVVHSVESGAKPLRAISVFTPPFDGMDRVFVRSD
jgi:mannose-6-phosphate isomerase-like protein (cupin superfamily)